MRTFWTILLGVALIAVIVPMAQFMTISVSQTDMETATPAGWVFGLVFSLILAVAAIRAISRYQLVSRQSVVILFCMLSIAVPVMNLGLVRPLFLALYAVQKNFVLYGSNTYRTAYENESSAWYPLIPTPNGLAWNKANRLLQLLRDESVVKSREGARRTLMSGLAVEARSRADGRTERMAAFKALAEKLGPDEADSVLGGLAADKALAGAAESLGIVSTLEERARALHEGSHQAAGLLIEALRGVDELDLYHVSAIRKRFDRSTIRRIDVDFERMKAVDPVGVAGLQMRAQAYESRIGEWRATLSALGNTDYNRVRSTRAAAYAESFASASPDVLARVRTSFIYRSTGRERSAIMGQDGRAGTPNENLLGFDQSLWSDAVLAKQVESLSIWGRARLAPAGMPWGLWMRPLGSWFLLILCLFLFLMCLAEWLRRKWVDRENLAFPLVEIADSIIRHDYVLESAENVCDPARRKRAFHPLFWVGCSVSLLIVGVEVLGHYRILDDISVLGYDVSKNVFTDGEWKELDHVVFILSPITVGLLYLVSLEVSLSIWAIFILFKVSFWLIKLGNPEIIDGVFTGYGGGRLFPFSMEQLLGAAFCHALILLFKAWQSSREAGLHDGVLDNAYVMPRWNRIGLIVFPCVSLLLLWNLGVANLPFLLLVSAVLMALTIAGARLRAETGLPSPCYTYDFGKLPMVLGLTGFTGAKVYTAFVTFTFLPLTLLFRTLPQQLENIELARRNNIRFRTVAVATLVAFVAAALIGMVSFLILSYAQGGSVAGSGTTDGLTTDAAVSYPLWNAHFLGEGGLDKFIHAHPIRLWFIVVGFTLFGGFVWLRNRFMNFPFHPLGYLLLLFSTQFSGVSPYYKGLGSKLDLTETSWIWGSALVAWGLKKLIVKYGGMNAYKQSKPFFIGLVAGAVMVLFVVNMVDLAASLVACRPGITTGSFLKIFTGVTPFTPRVY